MSSRTGSGLAVFAALALALGACSSDDDPGDATVDTVDTTEAAADATTDTEPATTDATGEDGVDTATLTSEASPPDDATVVVTADETTEDRVVRRGGQSEIEQGQTFALDVVSLIDDAGGPAEVAFDRIRIGGYEAPGAGLLFRKRAIAGLMPGQLGVQIQRHG